MMKKVSGAPSWWQGPQTRSDVSILRQDVQTHPPRLPASARGTISCDPFVPSSPRGAASWSPPGGWDRYLCLQALGSASHLAGWSLGVKFCRGLRLCKTCCCCCWWCSAFGITTESQSGRLSAFVKITHA